MRAVKPFFNLHPQSSTAYPSKYRSLHRYILIDGSIVSSPLRSYSSLSHIHSTDIARSLSQSTETRCSHPKLKFLIACNAIRPSFPTAYCRSVVCWMVYSFPDCLCIPSARDSHHVICGAGTWIDRFSQQHPPKSDRETKHFVASLLHPQRITACEQRVLSLFDMLSGTESLSR